MVKCLKWHRTQRSEFRRLSPQCMHMYVHVHTYMYMVARLVEYLHSTQYVADSSST